MLGIDLRVAKAAWTVFLVGLAILVVYSIRGALFVLTLAVFLAYVVYPLVQLLDRWSSHRFPRTVLLSVLFAVIFLAVAIAGTFIGSRIGDEAASLSSQLPSLLEPTNLSQRIPLPGFLEAQRGRIGDFIGEQLKSGSGQAVPLMQQIGKNLLHGAGNLIYLVLIPILSFLLIREAPAIQERLRSVVRGSESQRWTNILADLNRLLSSYVRALALLSLATFTVYGVVLSIIGVPYSALLAGLSALLEVIPVVGPLAAAATILAVSGFAGYEHWLWVAIFILLYRLFQDYVLAPHLMGKGVELSSLLVILGFIAGEELGGVVGIFLSVPVLAAAKIIFIGLTESPDASR